jgi:hypothetical protein
MFIWANENFLNDLLWILSSFYHADNMTGTSKPRKKVTINELLNTKTLATSARTLNVRIVEHELRGQLRRLIVHFGTEQCQLCFVVDENRWQWHWILQKSLLWCGNEFSRKNYWQKKIARTCLLLLNTIESSIGTHSSNFSIFVA